MSGLVFRRNGSISLTGSQYTNPSTGTMRLCVRDSYGNIVRYGLTSNSSASEYSPTIHINGTKCYIGGADTTYECTYVTTSMTSYKYSTHVARDTPSAWEYISGSSSTRTSTSTKSSTKTLSYVNISSSTYKSSLYSTKGLGATKSSTKTYQSITTCACSTTVSHSTTNGVNTTTYTMSESYSYRATRSYSYTNGSKFSNNKATSTSSTSATYLYIAKTSISSSKTKTLSSYEVNSMGYTGGGYQTITVYFYSTFSPTSQTSTTSQQSITLGGYPSNINL